MNTCSHPSRPAAARCVVCGARLCQECRVFKKNRNYCFSCLPGKPPGFRSPLFSQVLSVVPGLGQLYAGAPMKGLVLMIAMGAALALETGPFLPFAILVFSLWDARMTALRRNFKLTGGKSGVPGAAEGDWMLLAASLVLAVLFAGLPDGIVPALKPWMLWASFFVVLALSMLLGRGGKNVETP